MDWLIDFVPAAMGIAVALVAWKVGKRVLGAVAFDDHALYSIHEGPYSRESPEERLARLKKARIAAEHQLWDSEFHALTHRPGSCPSCSGPRRSAARYSIYT